MTKKKPNHPEIDAEFQALIPPLSESELSGLEENVLEHGILDPLKVWNGILLDGHHRLALAKKHGLKYRVDEVKVGSRDEAKEWMVKLQLGRRNLAPFSRCELVSHLRPALIEAGKRRKAEAISAVRSGRPTPGIHEETNTATVLARMAGVGTSAIKQFVFVEKHADAATKTKLRMGDLALEPVYYKLRGKRPPSRRPQVPREEGEFEEECAYLKKEVARLNREHRQRQGLTRKVEDAVRAVLEDMPPPKLPPRPKASRKARTEYAVLMASDWQIGSLTEDFNTQVARDRVIDRFIPTMRKLVESRRHDAKLDTLHLFFGGDLVDGSGMRPAHCWEVDSTVLEQALYSCPRLMADLTLAMMDLFPIVKVECVRGNHGRSGPKSDPNPKTVNWDTAASRACELMLKGAIDGKRLSFHVEVEQFYRIVQVGKTRILLLHGDQFRGSGGFAGIPLYGISKKMAHWSQSLADWDLLIFGHYHSPAYGNFGTKSWYLNGTLQTGSPYALEELGMSSRPAQRVLFLDEDHGVIGDSIVWLD